MSAPEQETSGPPPTSAGQPLEDGRPALHGEDPATAAASPRPTGEAKALVKGMLILDVLAARRGPVPLTEIAAATEVNKATAHRLLASLVANGLARSLGDGNYGLGAHCLSLGQAFLEGLDVRREAMEAIRGVVAGTQETCHLGVLEGDQIVYIEKLDSPHAVRMHSRVGNTNPATTTGLGQVILAFSPDATVDEVFATAIPRRTARTITDVAAARARLAEVRERCYAIDDVENEEGIRCVAAPILDHRGLGAAGISIAGPEHRVTVEAVERIAPIVRDAGREISRRLGYAGPYPPAAA